MDGSGGSDEVRQARQQQQQQQRAARKAAKQQVKAAVLGRKPCTLCGRAADLLVRCQADASGKWQMACGRCWKEASGGRVDGSPEAPHYRYGGLWKNHHAGISGRGRVPKSASSPAAAVATLGEQQLGPPPAAAAASELEQQLLAEAERG